jgi:hypothetical protein
MTPPESIPPRAISSTGEIEPHESAHLGFECLLKPNDLLPILGLDDVAQIYKLIRSSARSPLPYRRIGKYLRFSPSELRAWIEGNRQAPRARGAEKRKGGGGDRRRAS